MIKLKTIVIILLVYVISFLSLRFDINLLYPYYYIKDLFFSPVNALAKDEEISLHKDFNNSIITSLKEDIEKLKELTDIKIVLSDFEMINATIIERNREYWFNSLTINKGTHDGIKEDMAVIDANGLIGRISEVRDSSSVVKLITTNDTKNKISVVIKGDKDIYGIMSGYDTNNDYLKIVIYDQEELIKEGLKVETTGMGGIFPSGILIGYTKDLFKERDGVTTIVRAKPSSKLEGEKYVTILQRKQALHN